MVKRKTVLWAHIMLTSSSEILLLLPRHSLKPSDLTIGKMLHHHVDERCPGACLTRRDRPRSKSCTWKKAGGRGFDQKKKKTKNLFQGVAPPLDLSAFGLLVCLT